MRTNAHGATYDDHKRDGQPYGEVNLPVDGSRYMRECDHEGERYIAIQAKGGLGVQVWQYEPATRRWHCILSPGQDAAWELREFYLLPDTRLILEAAPKDGHCDAVQWLVWSNEGQKP